MEELIAAVAMLWRGPVIGRKYLIFVVQLFARFRQSLVADGAR
jgi:hypothetical protein